jgi:hypothetical protein
MRELINTTKVRAPNPGLTLRGVSELLYFTFSHNLPVTYALKNPLFKPFPGR